MNILIAEDDPVTQHKLRVTLTKWGYDVVTACDGSEAWEILQSEAAPTLAVLDWVMPGLDGLEVCRRVRELNREPYTYMLLLTAHSKKEDLVAGMQAGADDYTVKPVDLNELRMRLRAARRMLDLQAELISAREALRAQATHDPLTGVWNRAGIMEALQRELARASRQGERIAVAMADLDHFKQINDTYGHMAGDAVLCGTVDRIRASIRTYDEVGRYGGEEFLLVLARSSAESASHVAERVRRCIAAEAVDTSEGIIPVTMSLGLAAMRPQGKEDGDALVHAADIALYRAKEGGRNRVVAVSLDPVDAGRTAVLV